MYRKFTNFVSVLIALAMVIILPLSIMAYDCETIDDEISYWQNRVSITCSLDQTSSACIDARQQFNNRTQWKAENCEFEPVDPCPGFSDVEVDWMGNSYKVDGADSYVVRFKILSSGDLSFCIQPTIPFNQCAPYQDGGNIPEATREKIALIHYAYKQSSQSNDLWVAAQIAIWNELGYWNTVNGKDKYGFGYSELESIINDTSRGRVHKIDVADVTISLNLNDSYSISKSCD